MCCIFTSQLVPDQSKAILALCQCCMECFILINYWFWQGVIPFIVFTVDVTYIISHTYWDATIAGEELLELLAVRTFQVGRPEMLTPPRHLVLPRCVQRCGFLFLNLAYLGRVYEIDCCLLSSLVPVHRIPFLRWHIYRICHGLWLDMIFIQ
jgi:hypothetical protein